MKKKRVLALWVLSPVLLATSPGWLPAPPTGGWAAWWSWSLADPQRALVLAAGGAALLIAAWLFVLTSLMLAVAAADPSGRAGRRAIDWLTPRFARNLVRTVLGVAVAIGPAAPALASGSSGVSLSSASPTLAAVPAPIVAAPELPPLLELDRPGTVVVSPTPATSAPPRSRRRKPAPSATNVPTHVVQPGDTLWALAAAQLPAGSSPALITRDWQHWYELNRAEIGVDPDLLLVGERLAIPRTTP